jgi:hypothetical protein
MTGSGEVFDEGLEKSCHQIEDVCRPILEHWRAGFANGLRIHDQEYASVVKDAVKSAGIPTTPSEAFALYRSLAVTPAVTAGEDQIAIETRAFVVAALEEVITKAEAQSISDMHARINFIDHAASHGAWNEIVSACANSLRRDLYALCRRSLERADEQQS